MAAAVGRALILRRWRRHEAAAALGAAALVAALASGLPLLRLASELTNAGADGLRVLAGARPWQLLGNSLALALAVTVVALAMGVPLGVLVARTDLIGRKALWALHAFPIALPPFLLGLGWFHVIGKHGLAGNEATSAWLFGWAGAVTVLALAFTPVVTSLVAVALLGFDAAQEEAARLVARPLRVAVRILVPGVAPAVALGALLVFVLAFSELGVPMFLRVEVFPAAVFARLGGVDFSPGEAAALALPLLPLVVGLALVERRLAGRRSFAVLGLRGGARTPLLLGRWRAPVSIAAWGLAAAAVLPICALAMRFVARGSLGELLSWTRGAPWNSLVASGVAATIVTGLSIVGGHALARRRLAAGFLDGLAVLAFITPAAVLGVGLIAVWSRPATAAIYSSAVILVIGFVARYLVIALRACAVAFAQIPVTMEEAAAASGARYGRRLVRILVPASGRGLLFAWLATFVFCLRDLEMAVLYYPPGGEPLTVRIFTLEANGPQAVVAGLACLQVVMTALAVAAGAFLLPRRQAA